MVDFPATGFSQGFSSGARLRQARNANDLAERRFQSNKDLQNRKFQLDKARGGRAQQDLNFKIGNKLLDTLKQQVEQVVAAEGVDPQARLKTLEGMKKIFGEVYQPSLAANGINVDLGGLIDAAASRVAKASDAATIARNTAAAQSQPEVLRGNAATARSKLGPVDVGAPTADDPTQVQKAFIDPVGGGAQNIPGTERSRITVQAPSLAGVGAVTGETPKAVGAVRESVREDVATIEEIDQTIKAFVDNPEAGGIVGTVIENVGGLLEQLGPPGKAIAEATGLATKDVTEARTKGRLLTSRLLSTITADESGRYSDFERKLAQDTLKTLGPTSSPDQIKTALETTKQTLERSQSRNLSRLLSVSGADLSTPEGIQKFGDVLLQNQFTEEQAVQALRDLRKRMGLTGG